jgi:prepilin-type N-terminal cleavage/methylation domain-containing protein
MSRGFTVLELIVVLSLVGVVSAAGWGAARRWVDRFAVVGAREAVVGFVTRARLRAVQSGGASVVLYEAPSRMVLVAGGIRTDSLDTQATFGVRLELSGSGSSATVAFDALGIGRLANRRVTLTRGRETAAVVISSYGRITRR